jgi:hypothetical protein
MHRWQAGQRPQERRELPGGLIPLSYHRLGFLALYGPQDGAPALRVGRLG